jgi:Tfp pilus assembly protein PilF
MNSNNPSRSKKSRKPAESFANAGSAEWVIPLIVGLTTFGVFLPVLRNQFVNWDDYETLVDNLRYRGLAWPQLRWMFTTFHMGPYQPLSWMTYGLDYLIWGMNPIGYHLTNLILHVGNAVFFYYVCRQLIARALSMPDHGSWRLTTSATFAALIFAIHPLRVESVAWATERRDVLSGFFFLWTLYCYLRANSNAYDDSQSKRWLGAALVTYVLSLLAKATAMTLPVILLLLDIYPLRRLGGGLRPWWTTAQREVLREKIPFAILAIAFAIVALIGQRQASALKSLDSYSVESRLAQVFFGASFYLWKTLVPVRLSPLYEISPQFSLWNPEILAGATATLIITVALYRLRKPLPAGLACWAYSVVTLAPVLGIVSIGSQLVAERYSYLSCLSWAVLAGGMFFYILPQPDQQKARVRSGVVAISVATVVLMVFAFLTWKQTAIWQNTATLWSHVLELDPNSSIAHYNLGRFLAKQGKHAAAIAHYREAITIRPDDADTHNNLGLLLAMRGDIKDSLEEFQRAVQINPNYAKAFFNLGRVYAREGEFEKAAQNYRQAAKLDPDEIEILSGLADALVRQGHLAEAVVYLQKVIALKPDLADAHAALARVLAAQGRKIEAEKHYQEALRLLKSPKQIQPLS